MYRCSVERSVNRDGIRTLCRFVNTLAQFCGEQIFIYRLVSGTQLLQGIFSSWNKEKLCLLGATEIF